jgi:hypothetical protein
MTDVERYTARDKTVGQILEDYENHRMDSTHGGSTTEYLQAAISVAVARSQERAADAQRRWSRVAAAAAWMGALVAVAALVVAIAR